MLLECDQEKMGGEAEKELSVIYRFSCQGVQRSEAATEESTCTMSTS